MVPSWDKQTQGWIHDKVTMQERLRTLRASLGSAKPPSTHQGSGAQQPKALPGAIPPGKSKTPPRGRSRAPPPGTYPDFGTLTLVPNRSNASASRGVGGSPEASHTPSKGRAAAQAAGRLLECEAVQGLCQLLEHHVAVLEQSQEPVGNLLQPGDSQAGKKMAYIHTLVHESAALGMVQ